MLPRIPDPDRTTVIANGEDPAIFSNLPVPSHWETQQLTQYGAQNEYDYEEPEFYATFYPPGDYRITISAEGFETTSWIITAIPDPNPPPPEEPTEPEEETRE